MKHELDTGICIVGAGAAGLAAALKLSAAKVPFLLVDKATFPRDKICGDGFGGKGLLTLKRLDPGILERFQRSGPGSPSWGSRIVSPGLKSAYIGFEKGMLENPPGYVVRRRELDHFLLQEVRQYGVGEILEGAEVTGASRTEGGILLTTAGEGPVIRCELMLLACGIPGHGLQGLVAGLPEAKDQGLGIRAYYEGVTGFGEDQAIEIHFLKELLPCYLWIFPLGGGAANVGLALPSERVVKKKIVLKELLSHLLEKYPHLKSRFSQAVMPGRMEAHRLAFYHGRIPVSSDRLLLLGDSARLVDPFTGEGIGNAMVSGAVAAETAMRALLAGDFSAKQLEAYDKALYDKLEKDLVLGQRLRDLAANRRLINLVVAKAAKSARVREALRDVLFGMNSMQDLSKPMFYAKLMLGLE